MSLSQDGPVGPRELAELVRARTKVSVAYAELRRRLYEERDPQTVVELLRSLAAHRADLGRLDEELAQRRPPPPEPSLPQPPAEPDSLDQADRQRPPVKAADDPSVIPTIPPASETVYVRPTGAPFVAAPPDVAPQPTGLADPPAEPPDAAPAADLRRWSAAPPLTMQTTAPPRPLSVRFMIEGPVGAGVTTVLAQLGDQFGATQQRATSRVGNVSVDLLEFEAGLFEGRAIGFEIIRITGDVRRGLRRFVRSLVDAIIVVVDSTSDGTTAAPGFVSEVLDDQRDIAQPDRPEVTVFANKADVDGALHADVLAAELLVESTVNVISTSRDRGYLYGFVLATNSAVKRVQRRDGDRMPRAAPLTFDGLLRHLDDHVRLQEGPSAEFGPSPAPAARPGPSVGAQPRGDLDPEPTMSVLNGQRNGSPPAKRPVGIEPVGPAAAPARFPGAAPAPVPPGSRPVEPTGNGRVEPTSTTDQRSSVSSNATPRQGVESDRRRRSSALRRLITALRGPDSDDVPGE